MIAFDSKRENFFSKSDLRKAKRFANIITDYITDLPLGPAALTQSLKTISFLTLLSTWSENQFTNKIINEDDFDLSIDLVKLAEKMFFTEDCSLYLIRPKYGKSGKHESNVLHLIASTSIPPKHYEDHESSADGKKGNGLLGHTVIENCTLNLSAIDIKNNSSHYNGTYKGHILFLESKRTKQILICPIRNRFGEVIGAMKLENKKGWASDNKFPFMEEKLFEAYCFSVGFLLENMRTRNFYFRQRSDIHNFGGLFEYDVLKEIDRILEKKKTPPYNQEDLERIYKRLCFIQNILKTFYCEPIDDLALESLGVQPALEKFLDYVKTAFPGLSKSCERVKFFLRWFER